MTRSCSTGGRPSPSSIWVMTQMSNEFKESWTAWYPNCLVGEADPSPPRQPKTNSLSDSRLQIPARFFVALIPAPPDGWTRSREIEERMRKMARRKSGCILLHQELCSEGGGRGGLAGVPRSA